MDRGEHPIARGAHRVDLRPPPDHGIQKLTIHGPVTRT